MSTSSSIPVPVRIEPFVLPPLEVPGRTGPVPSGEWGINIAAARDNFPHNGLQLFIPAWSAMGIGDSVQVLLGGNVAAADVIDQSEVGKRLTLFIESQRLMDGATTLAYRVTRFGTNPEPSDPLDIYVKLDRPGGQDQNGDVPGHSELHLTIDPDIISGGVDREQARQGVPVTIEPYPNIAEHDLIRLSWGGQFVHHRVTEEEAAGGQPIPMQVDEAVILAAGDSGPEGLAVVFEVYDMVDNRSEDWSAEIRIVVDTGNTRLDALIVKEAVNNVLDLNALGGRPATAQIIVTNVDFAIGDQLVVNLKGTSEEGVPVDITLPAHEVTSIPSVPEIPIPNADVRQLAKTQAIFSYRLIKKDGSGDRLSKGRFINVIGEVMRLAAPIALDRSQGSIDPDLPRTTIEIPWDDVMAEGQAIDLKWLGVRPDLSIYFPELDYHIISHNEAGEKKPIPMLVSGTHLAAIRGGTLELYYELLSDEMTRQLVRRESLHAAVLNVGEPRGELPVPIVEGEQDGVLDPEDVPLGTRLIVPMYNGIIAGDVVHYEWRGSNTGLTTDSIRLNSITAGRPVPFDIGYELVADNLGGTVEASYYVERVDGRTSISDVLSLEIGEQVARLELTVEDVEDGELNLDDVAAGVQAEVQPYVGMGSGDTVYLYWRDDKGSPPYETFKPISSNMKDKPVPFTVPFAVASASANANVTMTCRAELFNGSQLDSEPTEFFVRQGQEGQLPAPVIVEAKGTDTLDPEDVRNGANVLISEGARLKQGDSVTLTWQGRPGDGTVTPTVPVTRDGELRIPIAYTTVIANDGHSVHLRYTIARQGGGTEGPSPQSVYEVRSEQPSGTLKVMGARYNRGVYRASQTSRWLRAFNATTLQPVSAQWRYQGETDWTSALHWRDTQSWKPLQVRTSDDFVTLHPANIIGNGTDTVTLGQAAFVAHRDRGDVVGWGLNTYGADIPATIITMDDIVEVSCTRSAYAARRVDGHVVVWGNAADGGSMGGIDALGFEVVTGNAAAFAGIKTTGRVVAWGLAAGGGTVPAPINGFTDIRQVFATGTAFAALRRTGQVVAWGNSASGGEVPGDIAGFTDIVEVMGNIGAFAAWRANLTVVAWGAVGYGGTVPAEIARLTDIIELSSATSAAFAARRGTGQVVAWGAAANGGQVPELIAGLSDILSVSSTWQAFAALRGNGHVVAWGAAAMGGVVPAPIAALNDIVQVASSSQAFAALRKTGQVVAWGNVAVGGNTTPVESLLTQVLAIYGNTNGFVALTSDGRVVTWGHPDAGGNSDAVQDRLVGQVSYKQANATSRGRRRAANRSLATTSQ